MELPLPAWKILCIDDCTLRKYVIGILLERLFFMEKSVQVIKTSSIDDADSAIAEISDIAVILIDIEQDKTRSLQFIRDIRTKHRNNKVRIILRTGYPDTLPSKKHIQDYAIDGYIHKELTSEAQIEITVMTAIRAYQQIITTEERLSSLAGSIAHEMRSPLAQIHGNLFVIEELQKEIPESPYRNPIVENHIKDAKSAIYSGLQIIDMTMDAIKEKPVDQDSFIILSARAIVHEAVETYAHIDIANANKISVAGDDFEVLGDPVIIKYMLYNLMRNALWYVNNKPEAKVIISIVNTNNLQHIEVRDTGPGIAPEIIPHLFDNFYTVNKQGGTGLGLSYCNRTMTALGGDINCHSKVGEYTAFVLSFPKLSCSQIEQRVGKPLDASNEAKTPLEGKTVLVVEDNQMTRMIVSIILEKYGMYCVEAVNGQQAIQLLSGVYCHLIITDIQMPVMNGIELIKVVRQQEKSTEADRVPIIILSSEEGHLLDSAMQAGADTHISKPVTGDKLGRQLNRLWPA